MGVFNKINGNLGNAFFYAEKTLTPAQITGMLASPVLFDTIPAPASNQIIFVRNWGFCMPFNTTAYTGGGLFGLYYDSARVQGATANLAAAVLNSSSSVAPYNSGITGLINTVNSVGKRLYISNVTQAYASGDSPVTVWVEYAIMTLDAKIPFNAINNNSNSPALNIAFANISSAQLLNINTLPVTITPTPAAGVLLVPDRIMGVLLYNSAAYSSNALSLTYSGGAATGVSFLSTFVSQPNSTQQSSAFSNGFSSSPLSLAGQALRLTAGSNLVNGNSPIKLLLSYYSITL